MLWSELCLPKFIGWSLNPQCDYHWRQGLKEVIILKGGLKGGALIYRAGALIKEEEMPELSPSLCQLRTEWEDGHVQARKKDLIRHQIDQHFDLGLPSPQSCVKMNCCFSYPVYGVFFGSLSWLKQGALRTNWYSFLYIYRKKQIYKYIERGKYTNKSHCLKIVIKITVAYLKSLLKGPTFSPKKSWKTEIWMCAILPFLRHNAIEVCSDQDSFICIKNATKEVWEW